MSRDLLFLDLQYWHFYTFPSCISAKRMATSVRETLQRPHWPLVFRLGYNQLFAFETDVLIVALHNIIGSTRG